MKILPLFCALLTHLCRSSAIDEWQLPVFPSANPSTRLENSSTDKLIPRHLWIAVRDSQAPVNFQMPSLFERNKGWNIHITGNSEKDLFMQEKFSGTSLLWAYNMISSEAGAAKADIWRYAVLWMYGGAYIDDDSDMTTPLDKIIEPLDQIIVSFEKNGFNADRYHLSDSSTYSKNESARSLNIFEGRVLPNWAIISAPRHPFIARAMSNLVEIIRAEYIMEPVLRNLRTEYRWAVVMCATGPSMMTASAREVVIENPPGLTYKLVSQDFRDYGGKFKAVATRVRDDPNHYMNMHKKKSLQFLRAYQNETAVTPANLLAWEGEAIQAQNDKEIFVVKCGLRRGIPNFDTFLALNFTLADVRVLSDWKVSGIPKGDPMPSMDYQYPA